MSIRTITSVAHRILLLGRRTGYGIGMRAVFILPTLACSPRVGESGGTGATTSTSETTSNSVSASSNSESTEESESAGGTTHSVTSGTTTGEDQSTSTGTPIPDLPLCPGLTCGGAVWECTDGIDNDSDGAADLVDPECTGVCDNDEGSFQLGIPGDNIVCARDCMFDGNSGSGDDLCENDIRCDPEDPGALIGCANDSVQNGFCPGNPPNLDAQCPAFCEPLVLPGCDCFGCCTFVTDSGSVDVFLESSPDCALDNLAACLPCTSRVEECGNPCTPEACEICIGESAPPRGCPTNLCDSGNSCARHSDCACDEACLLGCCLPAPPG